MNIQKHLQEKIREGNLKIHLGCGPRNFGEEWLHIDLEKRDHVDIVCNAEKLPLPDNSAKLIYASHLIAYWDREEIIPVLTEWKRVLKPGGVLRISTPDFSKIVSEYIYQTAVGNDLRYWVERFLGMLYGKMNVTGNPIYHKIVYNSASLYHLLVNQIGFTSGNRWDWRLTDHSNIDDHSQAYLPHMEKENGRLMSLNMEFTK